MSRLLHTAFIPSLSFPSKTRSSVPGFRVKPWVVPVRSKIREIFMPALSSTMIEGKIVSLVKSEGEKLSKGESVVVVESDKADIALLAETDEEIADAKRWF